MEWYWVLLIVIGGMIVWLLLSALLYKQFFKRLYDILLSFVAIVFLSPILIIVAILVRAKLGTPILYKTKRTGRNENTFTLVKFRSMTNEKNENGKLLPDTERLTKFGRILRSLSLDELPELFNILKGDMSIVGPRPLPPIYLPYYYDEEKHRHDIRPGLTGWAQVNGRNSIKWEKKFKYDVEYVNNVSLFFDLKILILTVKKVLIREGIGQGEEHPGSLNEIRNNTDKEKENDD